MKRYRGKWVALAGDERTVIAAAATLRQAVTQAKKRGVDRPILTHVPPKVIPYVGGIRSAE